MQIDKLIPFADDYLLFGCEVAIWMMTGDEGYRE